MAGSRRAHVILVLLACELASVADRLPDPDPKTYCGGVGAPDTAFWFGYPDGRQYAVVYENGACDTYLGPHEIRADGFKLQQAFVEALRAQRSAETPPPLTTTPTCAASTSGPRSTIVDATSLPLVSAVSCRSHGRSVQTAQVGQDQLDLINADVRAEPAPTTYPHCEQNDVVDIDGLDAWGDSVPISGRCGLFSLPSTSFTGGQGDQVWRASTAVQKMLAGLPYR